MEKGFLFNKETGKLKKNIMNDYFLELCEYEDYVQNTKENVFIRFKEDYDEEVKGYERKETKLDRERKVKEKWISELNNEISLQYFNDINNEKDMEEDVYRLINILISDRYQNEIRGMEYNEEKIENCFIKYIPICDIDKFFRTGHWHSIIVDKDDEAKISRICISISKYGSERSDHYERYGLYEFVRDLIELFMDISKVAIFRGIKELEMRRWSNEI